MLRKLVTAIVGVSALIPGTVFGLGMGEVQLESFLNQPLDARIELLQTRGLTPSEVIANLASSSEFAAAGVDRSFFLSQLKFEVEIGEDGKTYLKIISKRPVTEPYLNFLVEVQWPAGRLLREYTLLLDPPEFKDELPLAIRAPERAVAQPEAADVGVALSDDSPSVVITADEPVPIEPKAVPDTGSTIAQDPIQETKMALDAPNLDTPKKQNDEMLATPAKPVPGSTLPAASDSTYKVKRGDTLSKIVQQTQANPQVPMVQALVAYQYLNPDAFIDDNMNLIKTGAVLRVPSEDQIRQVTRSEAIQEIAVQNKAWRAKLQARSFAQEEQPLAARQLDGTGRELTPEKTPKPSDEGRLSLVTPGAEESVDEGASGRGDGNAATSLSGLEDQLAFQTEEVEKYSVSNESLVAELQDIASLVEKTDQVLVLKDDQIAALQTQLKLLREQEQAAQEMGSEEVLGEVPADESLVDVTPMEEMPAEEMLVEEPPADGDTSLQEFDEAIAEPAQKPSLFSNPLYLGAAGGLVLAVLVFLWVRSRREDEEDDDEDYDFDEELDEATHDKTDDHELADQDFSTESLDKQLLEAEDDFDIDTLLSEADIYVAYGHFPKAIAMLEDGLKESPNSIGLNLKMLEVYAESKDTGQFEKVEAHLRGVTSDDDTLSKINSMRSDLGLAVGEGPSGDTEGFSEEETQFLGEHTEVPTSSTEDEDFLSLADIEAELDVGGQGLNEKIPNPNTESFDEETTTDTRFNAEETQVNAEEELDLSGGEFDFNFEETSVPDDENLSLDEDLDAFSPDDALADIDEEIGNMDDDLAALSGAELNNSTLDETSLDLDESGLDLDLDEVEVDSTKLNAEQETRELDELDLGDLDSGELDLDSTALDLAPEQTSEASQAPFDGDDTFSLDEDSVIPEPATILNDEDASLLDGVDEVGTKLDLATAYIEMGDHEGAKDILDEVLLEGNDDQQQLAKNLLEKVG